MKRIAAICLLAAAGCSSAPVADLLDWVKPGRLPRDPGRYYGGVGNLQPAPEPLPATPPVEVPPPVPPPLRP
jgi:hypothetical protein